MNQDTFDAIVAGFYRATVGTIGWGEALLPDQQALSAYLVQLHAVNLSRGNVVFSYEVGDAPAKGKLGYIRQYHREDLRVGLLLSFKPVEWVYSWERFDEAYVANSPFYQDFLLFYGGRYASGAKVLADGPVNGIFGVHRGRFISARWSRPICAPGSSRKASLACFCMPCAPIP